MASKLNEMKKRITAILGKENPDDLFRSDENLQVYLEYLKTHVEHPCQVTGIEDFPWEEKYVFGYGDEKEYEKLKKTNPSYKDTFTLLEFERILEAERIFVTVERVTEQKTFFLPLEDLKAKSKKSPNYQLLEDYSYWYVNFQ